jgi:LmbE family N-acetylglucosaminyl deacetylase
VQMESSAVTDLKPLASLPVPNPFSRRVARSFFAHAARQVSAAELGRRAVVFSPHPDDESLGRGGTMLRKKQAGAALKLVHVSDGCAATTLIPRDELTTIRRRESVNAGRVLGLDDIYFLNFPDGHIWEHISVAIERADEILRRESPQEVFVPYGREPMRQAGDHVAGTDISLAAHRRQPNPITVWEYPEWFWLHWPWVDSRKTRHPCNRSIYVTDSLLSCFWARAFIDLKHRVDIADVLQQKRAAIGQHRSQSEKLIDDPRWITLEQLSNGELIDCFYQDSEFFRCYNCGGGDGATSSGI